MIRKRSPAEKAAHRKSERDRYALLKRGLIEAISLKNKRSPRCEMPVVATNLLTGGAYTTKCGARENLEIDHRYGTKFIQRKMNSVQRLERFAIEFVKWVGGDKKCELRLACRSCNARHQPKRTKQ